MYFPGIVETPIDPGTGGGGGSHSGLVFVNGCKIADFNCDGVVNIFDLSVLLYYIGRSGSEIIPYDLNEDSKIDFVDTSIVFYYWDSES